MNRTTHLDTVIKNNKNTKTYGKFAHRFVKGNSIKSLGINFYFPSVLPENILQIFFHAI